jgi:hypothetical protein
VCFTVSVRCAGAGVLAVPDDVPDDAVVPALDETRELGVVVRRLAVPALEPVRTGVRVVVVVVVVVRSTPDTVSVRAPVAPALVRSALSVESAGNGWSPRLQASAAHIMVTSVRRAVVIRMVCMQSPR